MKLNDRNKRRGVAGPKLLFGLSGAALAILIGLWWAGTEEEVSATSGPERWGGAQLSIEALPSFVGTREALLVEGASRGPLSKRTPASPWGTIRVVIDDETGGEPSFNLVLARVEEALGEVHLQKDMAPLELHNELEWRSGPLQAGEWMICVYQEAPKNSAYEAALERYTETVMVAPGETAEVRFRFRKDPSPIGRIYGEVVVDEGEPPPAVVGLWDETGRLVGGEITRFFSSSDEFKMRKLPDGRYRVGALWTNPKLGWPARGPVVASPSDTRVVVPVLFEGWFSQVELYPRGGGERFPGEVEVHPIIDGRLLFPHADGEEAPLLLACPPLDEHELQWLVLTEGHLPALYGEEDMEFFQESMHLFHDPVPGEGFALSVFEVTLDEIANNGDLDMIFAGRAALRGVQVSVGDEVLGRTDTAGLLFGALPSGWRAEEKTPLQVDGPWLLPAQEGTQRAVGKERSGIYTFSVLRR